MSEISGDLHVGHAEMGARESTMNSDVLDFMLQYRTDAFTIDFQVGETTSAGGTDFEMVADDGTGGTPIPGGTYDFRGGEQTFDTGDFDTSRYDPGTLAMGTGSAFNRTPKTDEEQYIQGDIEFNVNTGPIYAIKTGLRYSEHNTTSRRYEFIQDPNFNTVISTDEVRDGSIDSGQGLRQHRQVVEILGRFFKHRHL